MLLIEEVLYWMHWIKSKGDWNSVYNNWIFISVSIMHCKPGYLRLFITLTCLGFFYLLGFFCFSKNSAGFVAGQSSSPGYVCLPGTVLSRTAFCKQPPSVNDMLLNHPIIVLGMWEVASCLCSSCSMCSLGLLSAYPRSCTVGSRFFGLTCLE